MTCLLYFLSVFHVSGHSPLSSVPHVTVHASVSQIKISIIFLRKKREGYFLGLLYRVCYTTDNQHMDNLDKRLRVPSAGLPRIRRLEEKQDNCF